MPPHVADIAPLLLRSLKKLTKKDLFPAITDPAALSAAARAAPFILIAQDAAADPLLSYANSAATALFNLSASDVGKLPTRLLGRDERARAPSAAAHAAPRGLFSETTAGIRVSKDGARAFRIKDATTWVVTDDANVVRGAAAMFDKWTVVEAAAPALCALVDVRVKPEHVELFRALTVENARQSAREPGCVRFDVVQRADDPAAFTLVEAFADDDAERAHKESAHYIAWREVVAPLMAAPRTARRGVSVWPGDAAAFRGVKVA